MIENGGTTASEHPKNVSWIVSEFSFALATCELPFLQEVIAQYKAHNSANAQLPLTAAPSPVPVTSLSLIPSVTSPNLASMETATPITGAEVSFCSPPTAIAVSAAFSPQPPPPTPSPPTSIITEQNWDPELEIMKRITMKVQWAQNTRVDQAYGDVLNNIIGESLLWLHTVASNSLSLWLHTGFTPWVHTMASH